MPFNFVPTGRRLAGLSAAVATALALMAPTGAQAVISTTGCANANSCTLAELFAGGTITVDNVLFDNWADDLQDATGTGTVPDPSAINVIGLDSDPLNPFLMFDHFTGAFEDTVNSTVLDHSGDVYSAFFFDATSTSASLKINSTTLIMEVHTSTISDDWEIVGQSGADQLAGSLEVSINSQAALNLIDSETLGAAVDALTNVAPAVILANYDPDFDATLSATLYQSFSLVRQPTQAPEPGTLAILAAGLAGLGIARRRKR
ncbi:MAG: PEP-CTERM sorting domain-containing protein, partial [Rhodobacterales bacterium]|nr:PEP-CTERM sorting domain-containing protein [Rhodobacterales bacterium]